MDRSACGVNVSVSVALLLLVSVSVTPTGTVIEAVLVNKPVALALTVPVATYVTELPGGRSTVASLMLLDPLAVQFPPPEPVHVQLTGDSAAGKLSVTVAFGALLGPLLDTTTV